MTEDGISTDPSKTAALTERPRPRNVEDLRSFLGLAGYYRDHIHSYAEMAAPLTELTKKAVRWQWGGLEEKAYQSLIKALTGDTVLAHPRVDQGGWIVDTDASGQALGAVLSQIQNGQERVIRYASKKLSPAQTRYCTTKRELLGAVWALKAFRLYLQGRPCVLRTDHASVIWWKTMEVGMPDVIHRWLQYMSTFDVKVEFRAGKMDYHDHRLKDVVNEHVSAQQRVGVWRWKTMMVSQIWRLTQT